MKSLNSWFYLLFALVACAHSPTRGPAQVRSRSLTCDDVIEKLFDTASVKAQIEAAHRVVEAVEYHIGQQFPAQIREFMEHANSSPTCEDERLVPLYANDLRNRIEYLSSSLEVAKGSDTPIALLRSSLFTERNFADQMACFSACGAKDSSRISSKKNSCGDECKITEGFRDFYGQYGPVQFLSRICFLEASSIPDQVAFSSKFNSAKAPFYEYLESSRAQFERYIPLLQGLKSRLLSLQTDYRRFQESRKAATCPVTVYPWEKQVRKNVMFLSQGRERGSGFFVKTKHGRNLVTAAHVSNLTLGAPVKESRMANVVPADRLKAAKVEFVLAPGLHDTENDVTIKHVNENGNGLEVVQSDQVPEVGQKFFINGFPGALGRKYLSFQCTFKGFGQAMVNRKEFAYIFDCPGLPNISGMSGGPVVDEEGRVWGVNSSTTTYDSRMAATPLSVSANGELKSGIQKIFLSDDCYDAHEMVKRRCQVMPRALEESIP